MLVERELTRLPLSFSISSSSTSSTSSLSTGQSWTKPPIPTSCRPSKNTLSIPNQGLHVLWKSFPTISFETISDTRRSQRSLTKRKSTNTTTQTIRRRWQKYHHLDNLDGQVDFLKERFKEKKFFNNEEHKSLLKKVELSLSSSFIVSAAWQLSFWSTWQWLQWLQVRQKFKKTKKEPKAVAWWGGGATWRC